MMRCSEKDLFHRVDSTHLQCDLCPRYCRLQEGQRGLCYVRKNVNNCIVLDSYGRSSGFCIDPIEKKPLNHFLPGTSVLSFGTAGCNLSCKFCQNWDISRSRQQDSLTSIATPEQLANACADNHCRSIAFTYNDPVIFYEYALDTADACHQQDIKTVAVTAAYISDKARESFFDKMDAANIDLKSFSDTFYHRLTGGHLQVVLDSLLYLQQQGKTWYEITTLLIPGENDSDKELHQLSEWIAENLGQDVPLHFSAFHPDWKMKDIPATSLSTLIRARDIAMSKGLNFVYTGNVHYEAGDSSFCPQCKKPLIVRDWYEIRQWNLHNGHCECGYQLPGYIEDHPGDWGSKRKFLNL